MSSPASLLRRLAPALITALVVAAAGTLADLSSGAPGFANLTLLYAPAAVTTLYLSGLGGAATLLGAVLGRSLPAARLLGVAAMAGLAVYTAFFPWFGADPLPVPTRLPGQTVPLMLLAGLCGLLAAAQWKELERRGRSAAVLASGGGLAAGLLASCAAVWLLRFRLDAPSGWDAPTVLAFALAGGSAGWRWLRRSEMRAASLVAGMTGLTLLGAAPALDVPSPRPPALVAPEGQLQNIFLITVDTLRADAVYGSPSLTPNIDALARDSVVFENAFSAGPWTVPGLTSVLTGLSPKVHGRLQVSSPALDDSLPTLGTYFDEAGWRTAAVGANRFIQDLNLHQGFQWRHTHAHASLGQGFGFWALESLSPRFVWNPGTDQLVDWAIEWIDRPQTRPSLLWLHLYDPHEPYTPPEMFIDVEAAHPDIGVEFWGDQASDPNDLEPPVRDWIRELYDGEVRWVDDQIGRLLDALQDRGLYDDALIVLTSDHGEEFWEHGDYLHGQSLYGELLRVPLLIKLPGAATASRVSGYVSTVAVAPTVLDLAGVDYAPELFSAHSLRAQVDGDVAGEPVFATGTWTQENRSAVIFDGKKYVLWPLSGFELTYDLTTNPGEAPADPDEAVIADGRRLMAEHEERSAKLREALGVASEEDAELDPATIQRLRGLGYIQ